eukprot:1158195-Pelagomonas_calceolata.AAC.2
MFGQSKHVFGAHVPSKHQSFSLLSEGFGYENPGLAAFCWVVLQSSGTPQKQCFCGMIRSTVVSLDAGAQQEFIAAVSDCTSGKVVPAPAL